MQRRRTRKAKQNTSTQDRSHCESGEIVEVVVWNYFRRENTVDEEEGVREGGGEGSGAHNWGEVALLVPGCVGMWGCCFVCLLVPLIGDTRVKRIGCV
jgi:hypothetical protein